MNRPISGAMLTCAMLALGCGAVTAHEAEDDFAQNIKLFRPLAEKGNAIAQYNLGVMYASGQGVRRDYRQGLKWYRLAAAQGNALAQNNLGLMYAKGQGVKPDKLRAHMWLSLAAAQGERVAAEKRDGLARKMTPAQIAEAQNLARRCGQRNYANCD
jgi:uncharacterized protein